MKRYVPAPEVIETDLERELILLDPGSEEMFSLNETGRLVWRALPDATLEQMARAVADAFDVPLDRAQADVAALLEDLVAAGVVVER